MDTKKYENLAKILDAVPDQETKDRIMSKVVADPDIRFMMTILIGSKCIMAKFH